MKAEVVDGRILITLDDEVEGEELVHENDDVFDAIRKEWFPKFWQFQTLLSELVDFKVAE
jgi:hypothetical protein